MLKGKIKEISGSIILPTLSKIGKKAGDTFEISEENVNKFDIQMALGKGSIEINGVKKPKMSYVYNEGKKTFIIPKYGSLRGGEYLFILKNDVKNILNINSSIKEVNEKFINKIREKVEENKEESEFDSSFIGM
jgi:hypothetical protein